MKARLWMYRFWITLCWFMLGFTLVSFLGACAVNKPIAGFFNYFSFWVWVWLYHNFQAEFAETKMLRLCEKLSRSNGNYRQVSMVTVKYLDY